MEHHEKQFRKTDGLSLWSFAFGVIVGGGVFAIYVLLAAHHSSPPSSAPDLTSTANQQSQQQLQSCVSRAQQQYTAMADADPSLLSQAAQGLQSSTNACQVEYPKSGN